MLTECVLPNYYSLVFKLGFTVEQLIHHTLDAKVCKCNSEELERTIGWCHAGKEDEGLSFEDSIVFSHDSDVTSDFH